ncbi:hypothetical protein JCM17823_13840 [Halorubrum gandharaense]
MALKKALYYGAIGIAILVAVSIIVSVVSAVLSLAWAIVSGIISLAVLLGLVYVAYRVGAWIFGGSGDGSTTDGGRSAGRFGSEPADESEEPADPEERLRQEYVEGRISEEEFERRIGDHLDSGVTDAGDRSDDVSVERELDRLKDE